MANPLQEKALLVNLSVSAWTASKKDNKAGTAVKSQAAASAQAGWFNKRLVNPDSLKAIGKVEGRIRDFHYKHTLPWGDNGDRILSAMAYMDYVDGLRAIKGEFEQEVAKFVRDYPALVQSARTMLGTLYDPADYPTPESIATRFEVRSGFTPMPDAADFRVDVGIEALAEIKKNITDSISERLRVATKECWLRLDDVVGKMVRTLEDPETVFRDSLVENIRELTVLLPKMNLTSDINLTVAIRQIRADLLVDPDSLRRDKKLRAIVAEQAREILEGMIKPWTKTEAFPTT
jgi:Protein of unknown function (DUF3150).